MNNSNLKLQIPSSYFENENIKKIFQLQINAEKINAKSYHGEYFVLYKNNDANKSKSIYSNYYKLKIFSYFLNQSNQTELNAACGSMNILFLLKCNVNETPFKQINSSYNFEGNEIAKNIIESVFGHFFNKNSGIEKDFNLFLDKLSENLMKTIEKMKNLILENIIDNQFFHEKIKNSTNFNIFFIFLKCLTDQLQRNLGVLVFKRADLCIKKERTEKKINNVIEKLKYVLEVKANKLLNCFNKQKEIKSNDFIHNTIKADFYFTEQKEKIIKKFGHNSDHLKDNLKLLIQKRDQIKEKIKIIENIKKESGKENDLYSLIKKIKLNKSDIDLQKELLK